MQDWFPRALGCIKITPHRTFEFPDAWLGLSDPFQLAKNDRTEEELFISWSERGLQGFANISHSNRRGNTYSSCLEGTSRQVAHKFDSGSSLIFSIIQRHLIEFLFAMFNYFEQKFVCYVCLCPNIGNGQSQHVYL